MTRTRSSINPYTLDGHTVREQRETEARDWAKLASTIGDFMSYIPDHSWIDDEDLPEEAAVDVNSIYYDVYLALLEARREVEGVAGRVLSFTVSSFIDGEEAG